MDTCSLPNTINRDGFTVISDVLNDQQLADVCATIEPYCKNIEKQTGRAVHAIRNLFVELPQLIHVVGIPAVRELVSCVLGAKAFAVRAIYFDKPSGANWKVAWHQDQTIAVNSRTDLPGYGPWSIKQGVQHVEPPIEVLEQMLTVRLHLDNCDENNGALRVIPGSHNRGRLGPDDANSLITANGETTCTVDAGGAVLMRPTLLHASSEANSPTHRRVIHIEFAATPLPEAIDWAGPLIHLAENAETMD